MLSVRPPMRPASRKATGRAPAGSGRTVTAVIEKERRCRLGSSSDKQEIPDQYGVCFVTTVNAAGSRTRHKNTRPMGTHRYP
ncbi:hypothetical protein CSHISOI_11223 [Colletotrichum shisoi]|uniref:Uncharacterized protein n=1 Tax=Colletotrichum shisoi TaxID=2078593 RepID=A0A5Q4BBY7_9PEZI|nr:hypothetical protein CSHISOI_11223 [Colletotrichum shisoi]